MRKLTLGLCLVLMIISFPRELWAADALYRMLHAEEVASFREDQDAMIVGQLIGKKNEAFEVKVLKVLSGKVMSDSVLVSSDFTYGWNKGNPSISDFGVFSLKKTGSSYKKAWGIFKASSGDFKTLKLLPSNSPTTGLLADLASIEWYVNSGGRENDFSFEGNGYGVNAYVKKSNGESFQIYPKKGAEPSFAEIGILEAERDNATQGENTTPSETLLKGSLSNSLSEGINIAAFLAQNLVGWPGIITSFLLSLLGLIRKQPRWLVLGAIFALPISLYLSATPRFQYFMAVLPLFQFAAAYIIYKRKKAWIAWLLLVPFVSTMTWLGLNIG